MIEFTIPKVSLHQLGLIGSRSTGVNATVLATEARNKAQGSNPYNGNIYQSNAPDPELYKSDLGTSVFVDVTFDSVHYTDNQGKEYDTPRMTFQAILISVVFPRNIVKTEIQGRNGTVKEYIGEGDAQISFSGVITGSNGHYPADSVAALKQVIKAPVPIPVICAFLQNLDIDTIVFEDRNLEQEEGGYSYQTFLLNAISDTPQELQMTGI